MSNKEQTTKFDNSEDFLSMAANIGDALQLQSLGAKGQRYFAKLVGYLNKRSITVTQPKSGETVVAVAVGNQYFVRGFAGAKTYEYTATVLAVSEQPYAHIHLSFPDQVSTLQMRGAIRIKTKLPCFIVAAVSGLKMPAAINDLSTSGASIISNVKLGQRGEAIQINVNLPIEGEEQAYAISAIIRNVGESNADNSVTYGVEFVSTSNRVRIALQTYVYSILIAKQGE
jgi:c-di-GMP-binding flagellar brake protein YcgR